MENLIISIVVPILTSLIPFLGARHQANNELKKVREQQNAEIQKLKEQQNAEIQKIREQSLQNIERIKVEMEKQAELYEKNTQTDLIKGVFNKLLEGDTSGIESLIRFSQQIENDKFNPSGINATRKNK